MNCSKINLYKKCEETNKCYNTCNNYCENVNNHKNYLDHVFQPSVGDIVVNTNMGCKHNKSIGVVTSVNYLENDVGITVSYSAINSGVNWNYGDIITKTICQLSPYYGY